MPKHRIDFWIFSVAYCDCEPCGMYLEYNFLPRSTTQVFWNGITNTVFLSLKFG